MKNIRVFLSQNFQFLEVKFSLYLNRRVFVMLKGEWSTLGRFSAIFTREQLYDSFFAVLKR